ncbi:MAG TPA: CHC2 zinc finger domain-containing protein [Patescibacteria group bacterium]|nr:CHC2 zinc finger domain-containing protein [Patescibacteria group bacterium]
MDSFDDEDLLDFDVSETFLDSFHVPEVTWFRNAIAYKDSLIQQFGYANIAEVHELYEQIKGRLIWSNILPLLHIQVKQSRAGVFVCRCLFHFEKTPSLKFLPAPRVPRYICYGCGVRGDILGFVTNYFEFQSISEVIEFIDSFSYRCDSELQQELPF